MIGRKTENFFFRGVQQSIRESLHEAKIQMLLDVELDTGNDASWQEKLNATVQSAVDMRIEVLFLTCTDQPMSFVMALVRKYQYDHSFKSIWMIGGKCKLGTDCGHVLGGNQISPVETASFRDSLTGLTAQEVIDSEQWPADILSRSDANPGVLSDIFTVVSAAAQVMNHAEDIP